MDFNFTLYLITDRRLAGNRDLGELVRQAVAGGVTAVQLRDKEASGREVYELALALAKILSGTGVPLIINDRVDVAAVAPCQGVHLGQDDLPVAVARFILGPGKVIGVSAHTGEEARQAEAAGADYLGCGPAFPTTTKADTGALLGPEGLRRLAAGVRLPVAAIGGITEQNASRLNGLGLAGVAVIGAICAATDPRAAAARLREAFRG